MYKLYDKTSDIKFPNGKVMTAEEVKATGRYDNLFSGDVVMTLTENGTMTSYQFLSSMKDAYGVTEADPEKALELVIEAEAAAKAKQNEEMATIESLQAENAELKAQLEEAQLAIAELGILVAGTEG